MEMFGIEKVFGKTLAEQAEKKSAGGFGSLEKTEAEIVFFEQPLEVGQRWKTGDGNFDLVISDQRKGSGRYQIAFHDRKTGLSEVQLKRSEDLKEMLSSDGYKLISGTSETKETATPPLAAIVQETAAAGTDPQLPEPQPEQPERPEMPSLLDEYLSLSAEIQEITEKKSAAIGTAIGELLEENADVLGEKGAEFFGLRDTYIASVNSVVDEENALSETVEEAGQKITPLQMEATKANYKKLLVLYAELESLETSVNIYLEEEKYRSEAKDMPLPVSEGESVNALPEQADPASPNKVVHIDDYRKSVPSQPAAKSIDSPFMKKAERKATEQSTEIREEITNAEEKIGKEKYAALSRFVESSWKGFRAELVGKKIPKRVWGKVWQEEAVPHLKGRIEAFLREQTGLGADEYEAVCDTLIQAIAEKK